MRIAFHGKGGAGKTTTTAAFVRYLSKRHPFVLAIDADLNSHLQEALNISGQARHLGDHFEEVSNYLKGARLDLADRPMICTTPPSSHSNFVSISPDDPLLRQFALSAGNVALLTVGKYKQSDVSTTCYHEKLKSAMGIFHHMLDSENDFVVTDTIAGTDNIATSLSFAFDLNVFVVEPSEKSVQVLRDYLGLVPQYADRLLVVANKVARESDEEFMQERLPECRYLGTLPFSRNLKAFEQGDRSALDRLDNEFAECPTFEKLHNLLRTQKRDWSTYLKRLRASYAWDCERWYSDFLKCDLLAGIDQDFSYEGAIDRQKARQTALCTRGE